LHWFQSLAEHFQSTPGLNLRRLTLALTACRQSFSGGTSFSVGARRLYFTANTLRREDSQVYPSLCGPLRLSPPAGGVNAQAAKLPNTKNLNERHYGLIVANRISALNVAEDIVRRDLSSSKCLNLRLNCIYLYSTISPSFSVSGAHALQVTCPSISVTSNIPIPAGGHGDLLY
jgi:hypothetical protein